MRCPDLIVESLLWMKSLRRQFFSYLNFYSVVHACLKKVRLDPKFLTLLFLPLSSCNDSATVRYRIRATVKIGEIIQQESRVWSVTLKRTSMPNPIYVAEFHGEALVFELPKKSYFAILPLDIYNSLNEAMLLPDHLFGKRMMNNPDRVAALNEMKALNGSSSNFTCKYGYIKPVNGEYLNQNLCFKGALISNIKIPSSVEGVPIFDQQRMQEIGVKVLRMSAEITSDPVEYDNDKLFEWAKHSKDWSLMKQMNLPIESIYFRR